MKKSNLIFMKKSALTFNFYFIFSIFISSHFLIKLFRYIQNNLKITIKFIFNILFKRSESYIVI